MFRPFTGEGRGRSVEGERDRPTERPTAVKYPSKREREPSSERASDSQLAFDSSIGHRDGWRCRRRGRGRPRARLALQHVDYTITPRLQFVKGKKRYYTTLPVPETLFPPA